MAMTRRAFLRTAAVTGAALALPLVSVNTTPALAACEPGAEGSNPEECKPESGLLRPPGPPGFEPWWVSTFLPTKLWPNPDDVATPVESVEPGRLFRVDGPQEGYRVPVWDARENRIVYIGVEAIGPVGRPMWAEYSDDGRWIDVNLSIQQHLVAMQGDKEVFRDLVTAGVDRKTKPGFYRILRRVANETMDSRTVPDATHQYLLKDVLYTQYFAGDGSAIHYNWWASWWGHPGSQGCLGMRMDGAKFMWDWANVGTPLTIHY
ncbi:MAG: L,D-transpeptidase family protein [Chloroflexota bacterium]